MSKISNLYTGRAGHLAVMAELLLRGWNTAIPEVDVGDDIFVVHDRKGEPRRVQVKTAIAEPRKYGHSAQFTLRLSQLENPISPEVTYIFATLLHGSWSDFIVISREALDEEHQRYDMGSKDKNRDRLKLWLYFKKTSIICTQSDLSQYRNDWDTHFPIVED